MSDLNIATHIIEKCGGVDRVARYAGRSTVSVHRWTYAVEKGGTGGVIPAGLHQPILVGARLDGIPLIPDDFFDLSAVPPLPEPAHERAASSGEAA